MGYTANMGIRRNTTQPVCALTEAVRLDRARSGAATLCLTGNERLDAVAQILVESVIFLRQRFELS